MDNKNMTSDNKFDPTYTIDDLSIDIQEIIDSELKKDNNKENPWLCYSCGLLNTKLQNICVCGQVHSNPILESDSDSSFEIVNSDEGFKTTSLLFKTEPILKAEDNLNSETWLCPLCSTVSNNNKCCDKLIAKPHSNQHAAQNPKTDRNVWECAWCNIQNYSTYSKCQVCGHLRLEITTGNGNNVKSEKTNCSDSRKWVLTDVNKNVTDTDGSKKLNIDFSLTYFDEKNSTDNKFQTKPAVNNQNANENLRQDQQNFESIIDKSVNNYANDKKENTGFGNPTDVTDYVQTDKKLELVNDTNSNAAANISTKNNSVTDDAFEKTEQVNNINKNLNLHHDKRADSRDAKQTVEIVKSMTNDQLRINANEFNKFKQNGNEEIISQSKTKLLSKEVDGVQPVPKLITMNMLQEALRGVNSQELKHLAGVKISSKNSVSPTINNEVKLKYKMNAVTQTETSNTDLFGTSVRDHLNKNCVFGQKNPISTSQSKANDTLSKYTKQSGQSKNAQIKPSEDCHEITNWTCEKCGLINPSTVNNCVVCHGIKCERKEMPEIYPEDKILYHGIADINENNKSTQISNVYPLLDQFSEFGNSIVQDTTDKSVSNVPIRRSKMQISENYQECSEMNLEETEKYTICQAKEIICEKFEENLTTITENNEVKPVCNRTQQLVDLSYPVNDNYVNSSSNNASSLLYDFENISSWTCPLCKLIHFGNVDKCNACKTNCLLDLSNISEEETNLNSKFIKDGHTNSLQTSVNSDNADVKKNIERHTTELSNEIVSLGTWRCSTCTFINAANLTQCRICKKTKSEEEIFLTELNNSDDICDNKNSLEITSNLNKMDLEDQLGTNDQNWKCQLCLCMNSADLQRCKQCCIPLHVMTHVKNGNYQHWMCQQCSAINSTDLERCWKCHCCPKYLAQIMKNNEKIKKVYNNKFEFTSHLDHQVNAENEVNNHESLNWICNLCTLQNSKLTEKCSACGTSKETSNSLTTKGKAEHEKSNQKAANWICHQCTLENPEELEKCTVCQANKVVPSNLSNAESISENHKNDIANWKCCLCRTENSIDVIICTFCHTSIEILNENIENTPNSTSWNCHVCTVENSGDSDKCHICQTNKVKTPNQNQNESKTAINIPDKKDNLEWICSSCKLKNDLCNKICIACGIGFAKSIENAYKAVTKKEEGTINVTKKGKVLSNHWRCNVCTFITSTTLSHCRICKTENPSISVNENKQTTIVNKNPTKEWKCRVCTLNNSAECNKCSACDNDKLAQIETVDGNANDENLVNDLNDWICKVCTLKNPNDAILCSACQTSRLVELAIPAEEETSDTWKCPACTFLNHVDESECLLCGQFGKIRIIDCVPDLEKESKENSLGNNNSYLELVEVSNAVLVTNLEPFYCIICMSDCQPGDGVILSECLHQFCRVCLRGTVSNSDEQGVEILCPYVDNTYRCQAVLTERELRQILDENTYEKHLEAGLREARANITNMNADQVHQCRTTDCNGWCTYEDGVTDFWCPICFKDNCLNCQAIHEEETCAAYQERIQIEARTSVEAQQTHEALQNLLQRNEAMKCPKCNIIIAKRSGCDWLVCSFCRTEICWATRGARWGPGGRGDESGGCGCKLREGGRVCHPECGNCH